MQRDDSVYLKHIRDAILKIEELYETNLSNSFHKNTLIQDGVIRQIEIIGEATKRLSEQFRHEYWDISWDDIIGMRNKLIHDYFGIDI